MSDGERATTMLVRGRGVHLGGQRLSGRDLLRWSLNLGLQVVRVHGTYGLYRILGVKIDANRFASVALGASSWLCVGQSSSLCRD